jgi:hypothetical protein
LQDGSFVLVLKADADSTLAVLAGLILRTHEEAVASSLKLGNGFVIR